MGIYIWGTGCGAAELLRQGVDLKQISAFVETEPVRPEFMERPILKPNELSPEDVDLLVVSCRYSPEIQEACYRIGLCDDRILFVKNHFLLHDVNKSYITARSVLREDLVRSLQTQGRMIRPPIAFSHELLEAKDLENDYVRVKTLEIICSRLKDVPGAAAELGVYRGAFARCINRLLPERKLYLFDSFDGFAESEAADEVKCGNCDETFLAAHKNTSAQRVYQWMPYREQVIMMIGYFPESLQGLEEKFCLVSLDADFEETTLEGLRYFWPRISSGGYLLLHDYYSHTLQGVASALERYETEVGYRLPAVPICDVNGSLVLCKI